MKRLLFSGSELPFSLTLGLALLGAQTALAGARDPKEFWISTQTKTADLGTLAEPFDGSTQEKFDRLLTRLPSDCRVHILAGTYHTLGNYYRQLHTNLKSGQRISGDGIGKTIIQLSTNAPDDGAIFRSVIGTNIEVADLTLDCNYVPGVSGKVTRHGIALCGTMNAVRRVQVIHTAHFGGNSEAWAIFVSSGYGAKFNSEGNIIEDCEVSQHLGGSISALALVGTSGPQYWISGTIRNNRVFLTPGECCTTCAINGSYTHGWTVQDNYVEGAAAAFYGDTGDYENVVVAHNTFKNCFYGVSLQATRRKNITFAFNTILLNPNRFVYHASAFTFVDNGFYANLTIDGNSVGLNGPPVPGVLYFFLSPANVDGLVVADNTVDPAFGSKFSHCEGVHLYNNLDPHGNPLRYLSQVKTPDSASRTTVTSDKYRALYDDRYIGVKSTGSVDIQLPPAMGCAGKELIIAKESPGWNKIRIDTTPPDTVDGHSSISFRSRHMVKTVISDGTNWFSR